MFRDPRDGLRWGGGPKFRFYWLGMLKRLGIHHRAPYAKWIPGTGDANERAKLESRLKAARN